MVPVFAVAAKRSKRSTLNMTFHHRHGKEHPGVSSSIMKTHKTRHDIPTQVRHSSYPRDDAQDEAEAGARDVGLNLNKDDKHLSWTSRRPGKSRPRAHVNTKESTSNPNYRDDMVQIRLALERTREMTSAVTNESQELKQDVERLLHEKDHLESVLRQTQDELAQAQVKIHKRETLVRRTHHKNLELQHELNVYVLEQEQRQHTDEDHHRHEQEKHELKLKFEKKLGTCQDRMLRDIRTLDELLTQHSAKNNHHSTSGQTLEQCMALTKSILVHSKHPKREPQNHVMQDNERLRHKVQTLEQELQRQTPKTFPKYENNEEDHQSQKALALIPKYRMVIVKYRGEIECLNAMLTQERETSDDLRVQLAHYKAAHWQHEDLEPQDHDIVYPMDRDIQRLDKKQQQEEDKGELELAQVKEVVDPPSSSESSSSKLLAKVQSSLRASNHKNLRLEKRLAHQESLLEKYKHAVKDQRRQVASLRSSKNNENTGPTI